MASGDLPPDLTRTNVAYSMRITFAHVLLGLSNMRSNALSS